MAKKLKEFPPKVHNLDYLCEKTGINLPQEFQNFITSINKLSVPTRYPDDISKLLKVYKKRRTKDIL